MRVCGMRAHPLHLLCCRVVHEAGIGAGNDVGMDLWGLAVLDGMLTCTVSRRRR